MSPFATLIMAHLVADYLLQIRWMAMNKAQQWLPLITHSFVYTFVLGLTALFSFGGLSLSGLAIIFLSHVFWIAALLFIGGRKQSWESIWKRIGG